ncbi:hypothetical protein Skr01_69550 [Sphaerisporangium krabiense]|uniref:Uncharacterized protein n=1 Tax=Sphaerisporangium krabiense TaxID=763782 RepID=A0A7W8Z6G9_9ACTN|nr:hypothetical protein [Sphaerisporangium krabiense]MBB5628392.1 hypothetical protein [Sphaerisporangium krabiense]GII66870.1 hypothetical protein Skr01_69550 [Sphaerisporangium krabiense]
MTNVKYPEARAEVVLAIKSLADVDYQQRVWVERLYPQPGYYDDFTQNIHILYDDTAVLEDPISAVGIYLKSRDEADALISVARALENIFADLGTERPDADYLRSPLWGAVVEAAARASQVMSDG